MSSILLSYNHTSLNEHYVTLPTCLLKTLTSTTNLTSVNSLTNLEKLFFIKIVSAYQINKYQPVAIAAKEWSKSIGIHVSKTTMFGCEVLHLQKSLEKKGFLQVKRNKNHKNMDLRNILTPLIPSDLFAVLLHYPSNNTLDDSGKRADESDLQWILRTKLFVPIRYEVLKDLLSSQTTTANYKLFLLRTYLTAFQNFQVTGKLSFCSTTKELVEKSGMSRATIFRILKTIRDDNTSNVQITHQYLESDDIDSNRRDKSVFKLTFNTDFLPNWARQVLPVVSGFKTMSLKIPPLYNKENIIMKDIDRKDKNLENETSSFLSEFSNNKQELRRMNTKHLMFYYPLTLQEVNDLNWKSNREFSINFANQLMLKLACKYPDRTFPTRNHMMSYMTEVFIHEKHQGPLVNYESFRFSCNIGAEEQSILECEKYLTEVENSVNTSNAFQLKRKITGALESKLAYHLLTEGQFDYIQGKEEYEDNSFIVSLPDNLKLTNHQIKTLENQVNTVYGFIKISYETRKIYNYSGNRDLGNKISSSNSDRVGIEELDQNSRWYKIRKNLREELGENIDKSCLSKLTAEEDINTQTLTLLAPSNFYRDWINGRYGYVITRLANGEGFKFIDYTSIEDKEDYR